MENIKAVIFDMDNTLLNMTKGAYETFKMFYKEVFSDMDENSIEFQAVVQDTMVWYQDWHDSKDYAFNKVNAKYGSNIDYSEFLKFWAANIYKNETIFDHTVETVQYLKNKGYKVAIVTNGTIATQQPKIDYNHFAELFDIVIISGEVGFKKPQKEIFEYAVKQLEVEPSQAVYVGDLYSTDVVGSYRAGLKPVWFNQNRNIGNDDNITRIYAIEDLMNIL